MDQNITRLRAQDAAGEVASNPNSSPAAQRGRYKFPLIEIARLVAQLAAQRDGMTAQQLQAAPCPLENHSPLVLAARGACLERGYLADGSAPRFGAGDQREDPLAALQLQPGTRFAGYYNSDEVSGKTILDFMAALLEADPDEVQPGTVLELEAAWVQPQQWRVVRTGQALEVERISPPIEQAPAGPGPDWNACARMADLPAVHEALQGFADDPTGDNGTGLVRAVLKAARMAPPDDWILTSEHRPHDGQAVWISILTEYTNAPPDHGVTQAVFNYGQFRDPYSENVLRWPTHWKPRQRPAPPPLEVAA